MNYDNVLYRNHVDILCLFGILGIHSMLSFFDIRCVMVMRILSSFRLIGGRVGGRGRVGGFFICTFSLTLLGRNSSTRPLESI